MHLEFRLANKDDVEAVANLVYAFFSELRGKQGWEVGNFEKYLSEVKSYILRGDIFVLVYVDGKSVGYARVAERDGAYWIEEIYVEPSYRGRGLGKKLVRVVEEEILKYDDSVYIMVLPQDRDAFNFWVKMGYDELNSIELTKNLKPTEKDLDARIMEIFGKPLKIFKWKRETYSDSEKKFLEILAKFYEHGGDQEKFIEIVSKALEKWLEEKTEMFRGI